MILTPASELAASGVLPPGWRVRTVINDDLQFIIVKKTTNAT